MKALRWYEKIGFFLSVLFFLLIFISVDKPILNNISISFFCSTIASSLVSVFKDRHWQHLVSKNIDPNVIVFSSRDKYDKLIEEVKSAKEVDIMGISLQYTIEYLVDYTDDVSKKIGKIRILLPANNNICDERDLAQGTEIGNLSKTLNRTKTELEKIKRDYPKTFEIGYFSLSPYAAYTRIDNVIWVSPYITKRGRSCPLLKISKKKSSKLFDSYYEYFTTMWSANS